MRGDRQAADGVAWMFSGNFAHRRQWAAPWGRAACPMQSATVPTWNAGPSEKHSLAG